VAQEGLREDLWWTHAVVLGMYIPITAFLAYYDYNKPNPAITTLLVFLTAAVMAYAWSALKGAVEDWVGWVGLLSIIVGIPTITILSVYPDFPKMVIIALLWAGAWAIFFHMGREGRGEDEQNQPP
jgi:hypothetical protein